jgi:hypothetical protein
VLALTRTISVVTALSDLGLTYLMFLAGLELDVTHLREGRMGRAATAWLDRSTNRQPRRQAAGATNRRSGPRCRPAD